MNCKQQKQLNSLLKWLLTLMSFCAIISLVYTEALENHIKKQIEQIDKLTTDLEELDARIAEKCNKLLTTTTNNK